MKQLRKINKPRVKAKVTAKKVKRPSIATKVTAAKSPKRVKVNLNKKLAPTKAKPVRIAASVRLQPKAGKGAKATKPVLAKVSRLTKVSRIAPVVDLRKKTFRSRASMNGCSRRKLIAFAEGRMDLDEKLDVLYHLDRCQKCWDDLYLIRKSKNGQLYSRRTRNYTEADIKALEKESTPTDDEEMSEAETAFGVA